MTDERNAQAVDSLLRWVGSKTGLAFSGNARMSAEQGLKRAMQQLNADDVSAYASRVQTDKATFDRLIDELTVGETYFFRDPGQFEFIRREVLPTARKRRGENGVVSVWIAACASGEEAYSLAMMCSELGLTKKDVRILATDISLEALEKARLATYADWSLRGTGAVRAKKYLHESDKGYELDSSIRSMVGFDRLNLSEASYPSIASGVWSVDLIMCRNTLIYFDRTTIAAIARRMYDALAEGGWLITASGDPPLDEYAAFESVVTKDGVFYRRVAKTALVAEERLPTFRQSEPTDVRRSLHKTNVRIVEPTTAAPPTRVARPTTHPTTAPKDNISEARQAFDAGDYQRTIRLLDSKQNDAEAGLLYVQAWANVDEAKAEEACRRLAKDMPLSKELQHFHAVLLMNARRLTEATEAIRRALYLDRKLAIGHYTLGDILARSSDFDGARRAFRNARELCEKMPASEPLQSADGQTAGSLAEAARIQLEKLG